MPIRYRITKRTNNIANTPQTNYILQAVQTGTINLDDIAKQISNECTLSQVDVKMVLMALSEKLQFHLAEGKIVDIEGIGKFKIGFKSKSEDKKENLTPKRSILKYHLNFQPSAPIKRWLKKGIITYKEGSRSV
jgi:predicted histone-like DNA-binding protein